MEHGDEAVDEGAEDEQQQQPPVDAVYGAEVNEDVLRLAASMDVLDGVRGSLLTTIDQAGILIGIPLDPSEQPLPYGWQMAQTKDGRRFFINHNEQKTTWVSTPPYFLLLPVYCFSAPSALRPIQLSSIGCSPL